MIAALRLYYVCSAGLHFRETTRVVFAKTAMITTAMTTVVWLIATFVTSPESDEKLLSFLQARASQRVWMEANRQARPGNAEVRDAASNTFDWVMGCSWCTGACSGSANWFLSAGSREWRCSRLRR